MQIAASQTKGGTDSSAAAALDTLDIRRSIAVRAGLWSAVRSSEYRSIISSTVHPLASHALASDTALGAGMWLVVSPGLRAAARLYLSHVSTRVERHPTSAELAVHLNEQSKSYPFLNGE